VSAQIVVVIELDERGEALWDPFASTGRLWFSLATTILHFSGRESETEELEGEGG